MKLSSDKNHPDYHNVVWFVDQIMLDGTVVKSCIHIDTEAEELVCFSQPLKVVNDVLQTHVAKGKIDIIWRSALQSDNKLIGPGSLGLLEILKKDWEQREMLRKQEQHAAGNAAQTGATRSMKDLFHKILIGIGVLILIAVILSSLYAAHLCTERGGRYMRTFLTPYECVLP